MDFSRLTSLPAEIQKLAEVWYTLPDKIKRAILNLAELEPDAPHNVPKTRHICEGLIVFTSRYLWYTGA